jgi:hypothetical protein
MVAFATGWMEDIVRYLDKIYSGQSGDAALYGFGMSPWGSTWLLADFNRMVNGQDTGTHL